MLHRESFLMFPAAATHARVTSILLNLCSVVFALKFEPRPELIQWELECWVSSFAKVEVQNGRGASGLGHPTARIGGHRPFVGQKTRTNTHRSVPVGQGGQNPRLEQPLGLVFVLFSFRCPQISSAPQSSKSDITHRICTLKRHSLLQKHAPRSAKQSWVRRALALELEDPQPWRMELHGRIQSPHRSPILSTRGDRCTSRDMYKTTGSHLS